METEMEMFERRVVVEHQHMDRYGSEEDSVKVGSCGRVNNRKTGQYKLFGETNRNLLRNH